MSFTPERDPKALDDACNDKVMTGSHYPHVSQRLTEVEALTLKRAARRFHNRARSRLSGRQAFPAR
ncbi:hypothetical protein KBK24_0128330 [Burkholderia sp. K24]|nr:hypothetical protein KBK24_0128330 [Burkholderia sp. K24]USX08855.1 hypothetical protein NHH62_19320 [Paraburkholderia fungorum]